MPYYVYQVTLEQGEGLRPPLEGAVGFGMLQGTLEERGASLALFWPERTGAQTLLAIESPYRDAEITTAIEACTSGDVAFLDEGPSVVMALPRQLDVCSKCGAAPPRHLADCEFAISSPSGPEDVTGLTGM